MDNNPVSARPFEDKPFKDALLKDLVESKQNFFKMHEFFGLAYQSQIAEEVAALTAPAAATPKTGTMGVEANVTNGTTTPENVTGLSFAVDANKIYGFQFWVRGWSTAATCAIWFRFTGPGSPTSFWFHLDMLEVGTAYSLDQEVTAFDTDTASGSFQRGTRSLIPIRGFLVNGANPGTVQLQFRCEVAGQTVTVYAGSWGVWNKLN